MDDAREIRIRQYNELLQMKADAEKTLRAIPGIVAVSVGMKVTQGSVTDIMCLRVYVNEKRTTEQLPVDEQIPTHINGIPTDVNEMPNNVTGAAGKQHGHKKYRPLRGGIAIRSANSRHFYSGTLGCFVKDSEETEEPATIYLLTNYHVLMLNGEEAGHQVGQPDFCCEFCCLRCGEIAKITRWGDLFNDNVDCVIAELSNGQENNWTNEIPGLGEIRCTPLNEAGNPVTPVVPNDTVFKRGISSGVTQGVVVDVTAPISPKFDSKDGEITKLFLNQILIQRKPNLKAFSSKGDSGSVVLNHLNEVIGLHFADDEERDDNNVIKHKATMSYANPIQDVLRILKIKIPDTGTDKTLPLRFTEAEPEIRGTDVLDDLLDMIKAQPDGELLIEVFKKHRVEVMNLINTNKEVKVAWHRYHGPEFVAHLAQKAKDDAHTIPETIENVSYKRLLLKMSVVLEKNGSPEMASDIEKYSTKTLLMIGTLVHTLTHTVN